ncbi:MAG: SMC-Scp complex subunit ScpB [Anaerolineales bacterium]
MNDPQDISPEAEIAPDYSMSNEVESQDPEDVKLQARIEAVLFVASTGVSINQLATVLDETPYRIENALERLAESQADRGIRLQRTSNGVQLTSTPEAAADVENFLQLEEITRLTRAALEALAIVAYEQPVTRPQIDSIRGVNSDSVLRTLLRHGLIEEVGRTEGPGRPILYATTPDFLSHFGLGSIDDLPKLDIEADLAGLEKTQIETPGEEMESRDE